MLKLLKLIVLKRYSITQLREEVVVLRNNLDAANDMIIEMARLIQNQTQLIYQLKYKIENAEKNIETISDRNINQMVNKIGAEWRTDTTNNYKTVEKA